VVDRKRNSKEKFTKKGLKIIDLIVLCLIYKQTSKMK